VSFNPSAPNTIGLEWFPTAEGNTAISASTAAQALQVVSSAAETIDQLIVPSTWSGAASGYGRQWCDIYASTSVRGGNPTVLTYFPNEDKARSSNLTGDGGQTTNLFQRIDDASNDSSADSDYIWNNNSSATQTYRMQFGTAAIPNTKRIVSVTFQVRAKGFDWSWQQPSIILEWWDGATKLGNIGTIYPPQDYQWRNYTVGPFYLDFHNGGFWLQPEIVNLDSNTSRNLGLTLKYSAVVSRIAMEVAVVDETRVAVGIGALQSTLPAGLQSNLPIMLKTPLNVDNWAKASGTTYYVVTRRLDDPFSTLSTLSPQPVKLLGAACPHGQGVDLTATLENQGGNPTSITAGTATTTHAFVLGTSGGAQSADSQPYHDLDIKACHTSSTIEQGVNAASAQSYGRTRFLVAVNTAAQPTADLVVKLRRVSDNVQLGGDGTLEVADLATAIATAKGTVTFGTTTVSVYDVVVTLASNASLAAATNYFLEFTSTTAATNPWYLLWLDSTMSHALTGNQTYGGSTNQAEVAGAGTAGADFPATIGSVPIAPSGLSVTLQSHALPGGRSMQYAQVDWNSTSLTSSFTRYEVQRTVDGGATWADVATIATEADSDFDDYEGPRGTATSYRVRVVRSDGAFSDWTTQAGTVSPTMDGGLVVFTSNQDPTITTGFVVHGTETTYQFVSGQQHVKMALHDRDYQVVFKPSEERGVEWPFTLQVHTDHLNDPADGAGTRAFDTIRGISELDVPYLCMHTFDGERLFGSLAVVSGVRIEPSRGYLANCEFTQTQGDSTAVAL
jgi:hypothetical protein